MAAITSFSRRKVLPSAQCLQSSPCQFLLYRPSRRLLSYLLDQELISSFLVLLLLFGAASSKRRRLSRFEPDRDEIWQWFNVVQINMYRLTSQIFDLMLHFKDGGHSVISRRKVLPPDLYYIRTCWFTVCYRYDTSLTQLYQR